MHHPYLLLGAALWWGSSAILWRVIGALPTTNTSGAYLYVTAAVSPIVATVAGVYLTYKLRQIAERQEKAAAVMGDVHTIVNSQRTALENRIAQLEATIAESNAELPATTRETGHAN